jgi:hypothetical protein
MSTRSLICRLTRDGFSEPPIEGVYCHWDGYPSNNGRLLLDHYQDEEKLKRLLELGSLSFLQAEIGQKHGFGKALDEHPDWCLFYGRDREETEGIGKMTFKGDDESVLEQAKKCGCEYVYLYDHLHYEPARWLIWDVYERMLSRGWHLLTPEMCEQPVTA